MQKQAYLMESPEEGERLAIKSDGHATLQQLADFGLADLREGGHLVDAGSGIGHIASVAKNLLSPLGKSATVHLLDGSQDRLKEAQSTHCRSDGKVQFQFHHCDLEELPLNDDFADFVVCRFVFEYLKTPQKTFDELVRITRPGGKLVVGDLDLNCLNHFPLADEMQQRLGTLMAEISKTTGFDPYAGRKLFRYFQKAKLQNIRVQMYAHHLFYGPLPDSDYKNWDMKLKQMEMLQDSGQLKVDFSIRAFRQAFMEFLGQEDRFTYTPLIMVEGTKP